MSKCNLIVGYSSNPDSDFRVSFKEFRIFNEAFNDVKIKLYAGTILEKKFPNLVVFYRGLDSTMKEEMVGREEIDSSFT